MRFICFSLNDWFWCLLMVVLENTTKLPDGVNIFSDEHNSEFLWGMYRPHLYYGMRTRVGIDSLMLGFMWYQPGPNPYHVCWCFVWLIVD